MHRRAFLLSTVAGSALCAMPSTYASAVLDGHAIRTSDTSVELTWSDTSSPAATFVSSDPDAQPEFMHPLKAGMRSGKADFPLGVSPRPYILLRTADDRQVRIAERLLPLRGGRNFRDIGGYRAEDGRQVRWGKIYRSGVMSSLTVADMDYLSTLGIRVICDLRSVEEREADPNPFIKTYAPQVVATDYVTPSLDGMHHASNRADAVIAFADLYINLLEILTPQLTDMFDRLVHRDAPLAFNCSAGKDRTGMTAALVLSVLGVPRSTVVKDYALTQFYTPPADYLNQMAAGHAFPGMSRVQAKALTRMPREVQEVMMGSDPLVMRAALATVDSKFGGPVELAKSRFGLTDDRIAAMRAAYLI